MNCTLKNALDYPSPREREIVQYGDFIPNIRKMGGGLSRRANQRTKTNYNSWLIKFELFTAASMVSCISEALNIPLSELFKELECRLGKNFHITDV